MAFLFTPCFEFIPRGQIFFFFWLSVIIIERSKDEEASLVKVFLLPQKKEKINIIVNGHKAFLSLSCILFPTMSFNLDNVYDHA